jgi:signal transduction histidine kinase
MAHAAPQTETVPAPQPAESRAPAPVPPSLPPSLDEQKLAFLRLVTHELRTPLNSILGFSEIISAELYGPLGAPQYKEYAEIIRGSGKRLLQLVNQVLEIGRLQGLRLQLRPEPLEPLLEEAIAGLGEAFATRGLTSRILADKPKAAVLADAWGLRTALTHLLHNAATFSPPGGEVRARIMAHGGVVDLYIEDDGEGVDPEELPRLLQPFERGPRAADLCPDGSGLGLTICDLTCRAMGARLSLRSPPGRGLSARVRLQAAP